MPKISVIVPVYNVEQYLNRCIDSILNQTYADLEIILVDDGSPDNCPMLCDQAAQRDHRIVVMHKENGGVSSARNYGIEAATGEYVAFVDGDDFVDCHYIEYLLKACEEQKADVAYCGIKMITDESQVVDIVSFEEQSIQVETGCDCIKYFFPLWCIPNMVNKLIKRELLFTLRFPDACRAEDLWMSYHVLASAERVAGIKHCVLYYYWQHEGSAMRQLTCTYIEDELRMRLDTYISLLSGKFPVSREFSAQTLRTFLDFCLSARRSNGELRRILKQWGRLLVKNMWLPLAEKKYEKLKFYILYISPQLWVLLRLVEYKVFKVPLYLE